MTIDQADHIITSAAKEYNAHARASQRNEIAVVGAEPGSAISIPTGMTFSGPNGTVAAGMHQTLTVDVLVINRTMRPESMVSTFFHELGHAVFEATHAKPWKEIDNEAFAIAYSLRCLHQHGLDLLARSEAASVQEMATADPYKGAVSKLQAEKNGWWVKYAHL